MRSSPESYAEVVISMPLTTLQRDHAHLLVKECGVRKTSLHINQKARQSCVCRALKKSVLPKTLWARWSVAATATASACGSSDARHAEDARTDQQPCIGTTSASGNDRLGSGHRLRRKGRRRSCTEVRSDRNRRLARHGHRTTIRTQLDCSAGSRCHLVARKNLIVRAKAESLGAALNDNLPHISRNARHISNTLSDSSAGPQADHQNTRDQEFAHEKPPLVKIGLP